MMKKYFKRGLKPEIELRLTPLDNIDDTVDRAIEIERELTSKQALRNRGHARPSQDARQAPTCQICWKTGHTANICREKTGTQGQESSNKNLGTDILICQICKKRGHSADECFHRNSRAQIPQRPRAPVHHVQNQKPEPVTSNSGPICQFCATPGHIAKTCPKIRSATSAPTTNLVCQFCERPGHTANRCFKLQNAQQPRTNAPPQYQSQQRVTFAPSGQNAGGRIGVESCQICGKTGHSADRCYLKDISGSNTNGPVCRYCKKSGHLIENCITRAYNNNQQRNAIPENSSGLPRSGAQRGANLSTRPVMMIDTQESPIEEFEELQ